MKLEELITELEVLLEKLGDEVDVQVHFQSHWPLRAPVVNVTTVWGAMKNDEDAHLNMEDDKDYNTADMTHKECQETFGDNAVILALGTAGEYGLRTAWEDNEE